MYAASSSRDDRFDGSSTHTNNELDSTGDVDEDQPTGPSPVRALERGLSLLRLFDSQHQEWSLMELSRRSGLHKATTYRFIKTLGAMGFVLQGPDGKYSLGPSVFQMAYVWLSYARLADIARPHVEALTAATDATSGLTLWNGEGALVIVYVPTPHAFKPVPTLGDTFTDLASAHMKVLLAYGPEERRYRALQDPIRQLTPFTLTQPEAVAAELGRVAQEGVAYDAQQLLTGVCGLSVPIWDYSGEVRASLGIAVPETRFGPSDVRRYIAELKRIAADLSFDLGYRASKP
jgi:IclR family pca regulon transcriptional regulator